MARLREAAGARTAADVQKAAREDLRRLRWDWLACAGVTAERAERCAIVQAEHKRLLAADLTDVERLELLKSFLDERGWL